MKQALELFKNFQDLGSKDLKQAAQATSGNHGVVTSAVSVHGPYAPTMFIFKRKRMSGLFSPFHITVEKMS